MRLRIIAEIQRKSPTTNMDRINQTGTYAVGSVNDYLHMVHDGDGHAQNQTSGDSPTKTEGQPSTSPSLDP